MEKFYLSDNFINVESPRAYYIPFGLETEVFSDREKSDRFLTLNDEWKIKEYKSVALVPDDFYSETPTDKIDVPSCVQIKGYDYNQYTNVYYPFPFNPPYTPNENPAYHYQRSFFLNVCAGVKYYLNFEGVDSCFYLYINGKFSGFSQVAHRISEFDITDKVVDGENTVDVLVLKWCFGSYFEDQDKLRFTGIFRDVYLLSRPKEHIVDYKIETETDGTVSFNYIKGAPATVKFNGEEKTLKEGERATFKISNPKLWSAETPNLYDLIVCANGEYIGEKVGIREIEIKKGVFYLNGEPIKLTGVNRHDFNRVNGATVTTEDIIKDLIVMKELNVNAIRTSHYPSCPEFYRLCDKYGFYVVSESDLECHGVSTHDFSRDYYEQYNDFAKDKKLEKIFVDRQTCNIKVHQNRPSVIIWSLGNESGYGVNFETCYDYVKTLDDTRPVHYEHACHVDQGKKRKSRAYYKTKVDIQSFMYLDYEKFANLKKDGREKRPLLLCEYSHSMGNSPGDLKYYWDIIRASDRYLGGFIWEFKDHGLLFNGKECYGGDYGEILHDGNFCIDGIVNSKCEITPKSLEMKKAYEPIEFFYSGGTLFIKSRLFFKTLSFNLSVIKKNGKAVVEQNTFNVSLSPKEEKRIEIGAAGCVILSATLIEDDGLLKKGFEFARAGFTAEDNFIPATFNAVSPIFSEDSEYITANSGDMSLKFSKFTGEIVGIEKGGKGYITSPISLNIYRAPTDNDRKIRKTWELLCYPLAKSEAHGIAITDGKIEIDGSFGTPVLQPVFNYKLRYSFVENGVRVNLKYKLNSGNAELPAVGFYFAVDKAFRNVEYYGYGPNESYIDKRLSAILDYYETTVDKMETPYLKPQENGSRYGTKFMNISDGERGLSFDGDFSFSVLPHSILEYANTPHSWELKDGIFNFVRIDGFMAGIGSNSCGPKLESKYFPKDADEFSFTLTVK